MSAQLPVVLQSMQIGHFGHGGDAVAGTGEVEPLLDLLVALLHLLRRETCEGAVLSGDVEALGRGRERYDVGSDAFVRLDHGDVPEAG